MAAIAMGMALFAAPAEGATIRTDPGYPATSHDFVFTAAPGEANRVTITWTAEQLIVRDTGVAQIDADGACRATSDPQRVECPIDRAPEAGGDHPEQALFALGDGDDSATVIPSGGTDDSTRVGGQAGDDTLTGAGGNESFAGGGGADTLEAGANSDFVSGSYSTWFSADPAIEPDGDDIVRAGAGDDFLEGGPGDDTLDAGDGNDKLIGGIGADEHLGGPGHDFVRWLGSFHWETEAPAEPLTIDFGGGDNDGGPSDGPAGARDDVHGDIEAVSGGPYDDRITGDARANAIDASMGDDEVNGGAGPDILIGGDVYNAGNAPQTDDDTIRGGSGDDDIDGGDGRDDIDGEGDNDVVDGGNRAHGTDDRVSAGPGDDLVFGGHIAYAAQFGDQEIWPDGPDVFDGAAGDDRIVTRDEVYDPHECAAFWGSAATPADCWGADTPQNCEPGSPMCADPADSGSCGPGDDQVWTDPADSLSECEVVDPAAPVPVAAAGLPGDANAAVATGAAGNGAAPHRAVETSVRSPIAGGVAIAQAPAPGGRAGAHSVLPIAVSTTAPTATPAKPLTFGFTVDVSRTAGNVPGLAVYRDGATVHDCVGSDGRATPDPCVARRRDVGGDAVVTVRSSRAGQWRFGAVPVAAPGRPPHPAARDTQRPVLRLLIRKRIKLRTLLRGLRVPLRCSEPCTARVELRLSRKFARKLRLKTVAGRKTKRLRGRGSVRVKLNRKAARKLKRRRRGFRIVVVASAADTAGNRARSARRGVAVKR